MSDEFTAAHVTTARKDGMYVLFFFIGAFVGAICSAIVVWGAFQGTAHVATTGCAQVYDASNKLKNVDQAIFDQRNKTIEDLSAQLDAKYRYVTLVYDADALLTIERAGMGLTQAFPSDTSAPYPGYPRWIIPGKIEPLIVGDAQGSNFAYFDITTGKYDGNYLPKTPHTKR